jgi:hypothetical protein
MAGAASMIDQRTSAYSCTGSKKSWLRQRKAKTESNLFRLTREKSEPEKDPHSPMARPQESV